ncbi:hypothetical protein [Nannocystis pusilla]|uniref:hypothetical protein n=1 Tax=Nannocystis pusilla TaxID=889268 RepID=UPI003DA550ED
MKCGKAGMTAEPNLPAAAWRAWLSDDTGSPSTRFDSAFTGWYQLVDGPIAKSWSKLTDGNLGDVGRHSAIASAWTSAACYSPYLSLPRKIRPWAASM